MYLKVGIVVCCAVAAALIVYFFWGSPESEAQTFEFTIDLKCAACDAVYDLTGSDYQEAIKKANFDEPVFCRKCSQQRAYTAVECQKCNIWYFANAVEGTNGRCPNCEPSVKEQGSEVERVERPKTRSS